MSDIISFRPPPMTTVDPDTQHKFDIKMASIKEPYNFHSESKKHQWTERRYQNKSIVNRSSVSHNIISHGANTESGNMQIGTLNNKILFRKKSICQFADEARITAQHWNPDFGRAMSENRKCYYKLNNMCSYMYDSAHRFGIAKPFKV